MSCWFSGSKDELIKISLWPTVCEWLCKHFWKAVICILSYDWQGVSYIEEGSLIFLMINREWVTLHILWKAVSLHGFLWPIGCEWHCIFVKGGLIACFPMTNRMWVTLYILCKAVSSHLFLMMNSQWVTMHFCERHDSHHIFSYEQQGVSDIAYFVKSSLITSVSYDEQPVSDITHFVKGVLIASLPMTNREWVTLYMSLTISFPMTNRMWVTSHILWKAVSSHLFPMMNRQWVTLHILWKVFSKHLLLWSTGCEWHCTFCERLSHHIFSCEQQGVGDIACFVKGSLITSFPMTNSKWVILHILWKAISSHLFLRPTVCEWHCTICERYWSHCMFSYEQQLVRTLHILWEVVSHLLLWATES